MPIAVGLALLCGVCGGLAGAVPEVPLVVSVEPRGRTFRHVHDGGRPGRPVLFSDGAVFRPVL